MPSNLLLTHTHIGPTGHPWSKTRRETPIERVAPLCPVDDKVAAWEACAHEPYPCLHPSHRKTPRRNRVPACSLRRDLAHISANPAIEIWSCQDDRCRPSARTRRPVAHHRHALGSLRVAATRFAAGCATVLTLLGSRRPGSDASCANWLGRSRPTTQMDVRAATCGLRPRVLKWNGCAAPAAASCRYVLLRLAVPRTAALAVISRAPRPRTRRRRRPRSCRQG